MEYFRRYIKELENIFPFSSFSWKSGVRKVDLSAELNMKATRRSTLRYTYLRRQVGHNAADITSRRLRGQIQFYSYTIKGWNCIHVAISHARFHAYFRGWYMEWSVGESE
jgi:hypothetical protein